MNLIHEKLLNEILDVVESIKSLWEEKLHYLKESAILNIKNNIFQIN